MPRAARVLWLLCLPLLARGADLVPPPELLFGPPTPTERKLLSPPPQARSGALRLELVCVDWFRGEPSPWQRLYLRCTADEGLLPADLTVLEAPYATDAAGDELTARVETVYRAEAGRAAEAWLTLVLTGTSRRLRALGLTVGPPPPRAELTETVDLRSLGTPSRLERAGLALDPTLVRRETAPLDTTPDGPPYYFGVDSTLGRADEPPAATAQQPYLSLRLHTLGPEAGVGGWRLSNLRLTAADGSRVDDWRYVRRRWRPDWGGWLGVTGTDQERHTPELVRGVLLDGVDAGGPAQRGGLRVGDLITAVNEHAAPDAYTLGERIRQCAAGAGVRLSLWRGDKPLQLTLKLGTAALWPDRDDAELRAVWDRLAALRPAALAAADVLDCWDWQARTPLPEALEPRQLTLVFTRDEPARGTTFLLRGLPLTG